MKNGAPKSKLLISIPSLKAKAEPDILGVSCHNNNYNHISKHFKARNSGTVDFRRLVCLMPSVPPCVRSTQRRSKDPSITPGRPKLMTRPSHWFKLGTYVAGPYQRQE